jgi:hypothetical protein
LRETITFHARAQEKKDSRRKEGLKGLETSVDIYPLRSLWLIKGIKENGRVEKRACQEDFRA